MEIFEEVADASDFEALRALRSRTDPLLNHRLHHALTIPPKERAYGPGARYVMTPFVHPSPVGTRFRPAALSADSFGVYYAARDEATAIAEVSHHRVSFLQTSRAPAQDLDFELVKAAITGAGFYDLRGRQRDFPDVYSPTDYAASQRLGVELRRRGADGIVYDSVRREGGECVAVFRPRCVGGAKAVNHLIFRWDGERISAILEAHPLPARRRPARASRN